MANEASEEKSFFEFILEVNGKKWFVPIIWLFLVWSAIGCIILIMLFTYPLGSCANQQCRKKCKSDVSVCPGGTCISKCCRRTHEWTDDNGQYIVFPCLCFCENERENCLKSFTYCGDDETAQMTAGELEEVIDMGARTQKIPQRSNAPISASELDRTVEEVQLHPLNSQAQTDAKVSTKIEKDKLGPLTLTSTESNAPRITEDPTAEEVLELGETSCNSADHLKNLPNPPSPSRTPPPPPPGLVRLHSQHGSPFTLGKDVPLEAPPSIQSRDYSPANRDGISTQSVGDTSSELSELSMNELIL